jgi:hypothetical protein|tara:strand:- start:3583 stop:3990 length:408 start_codon:yes stop_codon:yes gene_type:complete
MSDKKNKNKNKNKKSAKIINFINKSSENKRIQTEDDEFKKMDNLAKELVNVYYKSAEKSFLSLGYCFYLFIYRLLQRMISNISFPLYRYYFRYASKQILENYEEWIEKYKDWDGCSINDNVEGANKTKNESDTVH